MTKFYIIGNVEFKVAGNDTFINMKSGEVWNHKQLNGYMKESRAIGIRVSVRYKEEAALSTINIITPWIIST